MQTIYRFEVPADDQPHTFDMGEGTASDPLRVENAGKVDAVEFWAQLDPHNTIKRRFQILATGQRIPAGYRYVGTAPRNHAGAVWHLFEVG